MKGRGREIKGFATRRLLSRWFQLSISRSCNLPPPFPPSHMNHQLHDSIQITPIHLSIHPDNSKIPTHGRTIVPYPGASSPHLPSRKPLNMVNSIEEYMYGRSYFATYDLNQRSSKIGKELLVKSVAYFNFFLKKIEKMKNRAGNRAWQNASSQNNQQKPFHKQEEIGKAALTRERNNNSVQLIIFNHIFWSNVSPSTLTSRNWDQICRMSIWWDDQTIG